MNYILQYILQLLKQTQEKTKEMSEQYINPFDEYLSSSEEEEISPFVNPLVTYLQENTSLKEELRETKNELTETKARLAKLEEQMAIVMDRSRLCTIVDFIGKSFVDLDYQEIRIHESCDNHVGGHCQIDVALNEHYSHIITPILRERHGASEILEQRQINNVYMLMRSLHNIRKINLSFYTGQHEREKHDISLYYTCNMIKLLVDRNTNIDINMEMYITTGSESFFRDLKKVFKQIDHNKINTITFRKEVLEPEKQEICDTITECNPGFLEKIVFTLL